MASKADSYKIAGVVVLYNPEDDVLENIESYFRDLDVLFLVDNSESPNTVLIEKIKRIKKFSYMPNNANLGVARALNIGAREAMKYGADFLLTMDQDSRAAEVLVPHMLSVLKNMDESKVGIIAPVCVGRYECRDIRPEVPESEEVSSAITSGSLLNLNAYKVAGPFREDLFIDYVDHEYCLRLRLKGYKIMRVNSAVLIHRLGNPIRIYKLFRRRKLENHSPVRKYYITRNRLYVSRMYKADFPDFYREKRKLFRRDLRRLLLYESNKMEKLKMVLRGYLDYRKGILGRFQENHQ
jgi:rhamnosyltransferase